MASAGFMPTVLMKLRRDRHLGLRNLFANGRRYAWELLTARLYLRGVDTVGPHARTLGKPRIQNRGRMEFGAHVLMRSVNVPAEICTGPNGILRVGNGVRINYGVSIGVLKEVVVGDRVLIGPYVMIVDSDFHDVYDRSVASPAQPIHIEDDVWIGAKASILKGVRIGRGSIVGVGSVVTRNVPQFTVVAGVPARPIGQLDPARFVQREVM